MRAEDQQRTLEVLKKAGLIPSERELSREEVSDLMPFLTLLADGSVSLKIPTANRNRRVKILATLAINGSKPIQNTPPKNWELLVYLLLPMPDCEALVGDLEERYRRLAKRLGKNRADIWYTKQVLTSIWPLLRDSIHKASSSAVIGIVAFVLRLVGMGSVADELKKLAGNTREKI